MSNCGQIIDIDNKSANSIIFFIWFDIFADLNGGKNKKT